MTTKIRYLLLSIYLFTFSHSYAQEDIRFAKGATTGTVRGEITSTTKTWQFRAQKGQRITAVLEPVGGDRGMLTLTIYAYCGEEYGKPLASDVLRWEGLLPCNDRYTLDVAPSADAMKAARVQRYTLTLTIN